jgi:hypothetical protein
MKVIWNSPLTKELHAVANLLYSAEGAAISAHEAKWQVAYIKCGRLSLK